VPRTSPLAVRAGRPPQRMGWHAEGALRARWRGAGMATPAEHDMMTEHEGMAQSWLDDADAGHHFGRILRPVRPPACAAPVAARVCGALHTVDMLPVSISRGSVRWLAHGAAGGRCSGTSRSRWST
jgi:hypothetical protein